MSKYKQQCRVKHYRPNILSESGREPRWERKQGDGSGPPPTACSGGERRPKQIFLQTAACSQLLQKALLRSESIFPTDSKELFPYQKCVKSELCCFSACFLLLSWGHLPNDSIVGGLVLWHCVMDLKTSPTLKSIFFSAICTVLH